jgi:predicted permease
MPTFFHVVLARVRALFRPRDLERDFDDELVVHLAMAEERKIQQGMTPEEARRTARMELGGLSQLREAGREMRGLPALSTCWLDAKLGARMLGRYWGLTVVGGLAMVIAFAIAGMIFGTLNLFVNPTLPFEEGHRIVALQKWHTGNQRSEETSEDFERWRDQLRSVVDVGAFRHGLRSLSIDNAATETVAVAEMSASGFDVTRVRPLLGRVFNDDEALPGANPVVVIGYEAWRTKFESDPAVLGQLIRLDGTPHTVIGIMPKDFAFPVNHSYWIPLPQSRFTTTEVEDTGARFLVFARLAGGTTIESVQAELETLGFASSGESVNTDPRLRSRVLPYTHAFNDPPGRIIYLIQFLVSLVLLPPCANIAILVYARTIARQKEFSARYALGASRRRIIGQLFVETLVLAAAAAGVAFALLTLIFEYVQSMMLGLGRPFWVWNDLGHFETAVYLAALAVAAAVIVGVLPAVRSTGRLLQSGLQALGSRSALRLGSTWTTMVVVQVAITVAAVPAAVDGVWYLRKGTQVPGFTEEVLTARVRMERRSADNNGNGFRERLAGTEAELMRRLRSAPGVRAATIGPAGPDAIGERAVVEIEGDKRKTPLRVTLNRVDEDFFDVFDMSLLAGRNFEAKDFTPNSGVVIVNRVLADGIAGDVLGRRLRLVDDADGPVPAEPNRWYEIVGIVEDDGAKLYQPLLPGRVHPAFLALDIGPDPTKSVSRVLEIAESADPTLHLDQFASLDSLIHRTNLAEYLVATGIAAMTLCVIFLSAAGVHALMSVILNQRRREIGIRLALGAPPYQLMNGIFRHAAFGLAAGAAGGILFAFLIRRIEPVWLVDFRLPGVIPMTAALMTLVGLIAASGPIRRALRVDPNETLRDA